MPELLPDWCPIDDYLSNSYQLATNQIYSTSRNPNKLKYSSFESSHQDESNGSKIKSLALIHHEITHAKYILKN
jgi:hypothetical protein